MRDPGDNTHVVLTGSIKCQLEQFRTDSRSRTSASCDVGRRTNVNEMQPWLFPFPMCKPLSEASASMARRQEDPPAVFPRPPEKGILNSWRSCVF